MSADIHFEDFHPGETSEYGAYRVTGEEIVAFAREFDPQPFHLDEDAAKRSLLGSLSASGWHTAAMLMRMNCDEWVNRSASLGSPGLSEVKWLKPVHPGDVLRARRTVLSARQSKSRPGMGLVECLFAALNQSGESVMTQQGFFLQALRGASAPTAFESGGVGEQNINAAPFATEFFEDVEIDAPRALGQVVMERDAILRFGRAYDPQPFHIDEAAARASVFGALAASGWHTAAAWMRAAVDARQTSAAALVARGERAPEPGPSPGFRDLAWLRPVLVGDTLRFFTKPISKRVTSRAGWGLVFSENTAINQAGVKVFKFTSGVFTQLREPA